MYRAKFGGAVGSRSRSEYMARPSWLAARKSSRSFPTIAGAVVMASSVHCRLGRTLHCLGAGAAEDSAGAVSFPGQPQQVHPFGVVELQGAGERVEHAGGHTGQRAAFELGVVLHAHPGQRGDLAAPEPGHAAFAGAGAARPVAG